MGGDQGLECAGGNGTETKGSGPVEKLTRTWKLESRSEGEGGAKDFSAQVREGLSLSETWRPRGKTSLRRDKRIPPSDLYNGVMALYASHLWKLNPCTGPKNEAQVGRSDRGV